MRGPGRSPSLQSARTLGACELNMGGHASGVLTEDHRHFWSQGHRGTSGGGARKPDARPGSQATGRRVTARQWGGRVTTPRASHACPASMPARPTLIKGIGTEMHQAWIRGQSVWVCPNRREYIPKYRSCDPSCKVSAPPLRLPPYEMNRASHSIPGAFLLGQWNDNKTGHVMLKQVIHLFACKRQQYMPCVRLHARWCMLCCACL